ncbi:MAG: AAA family ATPase, partial [archaeon]|nr:AAA family ATPase [archaeon]
MKVRTVSVVSYVNMRDRIFQIQPGLNVFYGPNEAGKSTLRSFITMTLFPKAGLKYPALKGSDSGAATVVLEDGSELVFERDGKKCSGLGSQICGIDDKEYISIYSMNPDDLRDVKGIEKGDIRNRFLTIPGGTDLPRAYAELDEERTKLLPDLKRSDKCEIAKLISIEHELKMKVRSLQNRETGDNNYAELCTKRRALEKQLEETKVRLSNADSNRTAAHKYETKAEILRNIQRLEEKEKKLAYAEGTDDRQLSKLEDDLARLRKELKDRKAKGETTRNNVSRYDVDAFLRNRRRIESLDRMSDEYDFLVSSRNQSQPVPTQSSGFPIITVAGAAVTVIGIAAAVVASPIAGVAIAAVGVILAVIGLRSKSKPADVSDNRGSDRLSYIENTLSDVAKDVGLQLTSFHADVELLNSVLKDILSIQEGENELHDYEQRVKDAETSLKLYLSGYGGEDKFKQAVVDADELIKVRSQLTALRESVETMGDAPLDTETADTEYRYAQEMFDAINRDLATVNQAIKDITDDMSVEDAMTEWTEADSAVYDATYRWARLMLEKIILDNASSDA